MFGLDGKMYKCIAGLQVQSDPFLKVCKNEQNEVQ